MRWRSLFLAVVLPATAALAACGGGDVTVRVMSSTAQQDSALPVEDNVVTFLPYDRDSIFAVLTEQAEQPEPTPPQDLKDQFDQVQQMQQRWREAEERWSEARDSLKNLKSRMDGLDRRSREYLQLFQQFDALEERVNRLDREKAQLFQRFDSLQKQTLERADSMQTVIRSWEDVAFADYIDISDSILRETGEEIRRDTTGTQGYASVSLPGGDWWVYTRHQPGPFEELYWNLHVMPGQTDTLILNRETAEVRRKF